MADHSEEMGKWMDEFVMSVADQYPDDFPENPVFEDLAVWLSETVRNYRDCYFAFRELVLRVSANDSVEQPLPEVCEPRSADADADEEETE